MYKNRCRYFIFSLINILESGRMGLVSKFFSSSPEGHCTNEMTFKKDRMSLFENT